MSRRDLLIGGVGLLGALSLAGCGSGSKPGATGTTTSKPRPTSSSSTSTSGANAATPACALTPEQTEGPFYLDDATVRSDITEGRPGVPLEVEFIVVDENKCAPLPGVALDIWHCDALGEYSGYGPNAQGAPGHVDPVNASRFLRGTQVTGADGRAKFTTIVPGWYSGRTVHIHVKAHPSATTQATTQVYLSEALLAAVYASEPYSQHAGAHIPYDQDSIYTQAKGPAPLTLSKQGSGYGTTFTMGIAV